MPAACLVLARVPLIAHHQTLALNIARLRHAAAQAPPLLPGFFVFVAANNKKRMLGSHSQTSSPMPPPRSVPVRVAYELQQAGHRYLDVRTEGEFSAGHPEGAVNIPYMYKTGSGMMKNIQFLEQVSVSFRKEDEIIVGCQSGKRSLIAATELCAAGFTAVTDIAGGFSSWRENGLPINQ